MDAKDSLCKLITALVEVAQPVERTLLLDFLLGNESQDITEYGMDNLEQFGCGDNRDDEFWGTVIDQGVEQGYLKSQRKGISPSAAGKKYLKKPTPFVLEDEDSDSLAQNDAALDELVRTALEDDENKPRRVVAPIKASSAKTRKELLLIQAIDRKMALDDFAESQDMTLDEMMDCLECIIHKGTRVDISYFVEEVLGQDCIDELDNYFSSAKDDSLETAIKEWDKIYKPEELRLARILYKNQTA